MSIEQKETIGSIVNWAFKIALSIAAYLLVTNFVELKESVRLIGGDVIGIRIQMQHVTDQVEANKIDIDKLDERKADKK